MQHIASAKQWQSARREVKRRWAQTIKMPGFCPKPGMGELHAVSQTRNKQVPLQALGLVEQPLNLSALLL